MTQRSFRLSIPCSSANLGPGFDVIGLALAVYLVVSIKIDVDSPHDKPFNCRVTYEGEGSDHVPLQADENLITRTALYVLRCHGLTTFPAGTNVHINNPIWLGRGLGSSGAAVVAGVMLGNSVANLGLSKDRMLDYCLMIERHPDNVTAAMIGGFVGSYLRELDPADIERVEIPLSEVLPEPAGGVDTGLPPPRPPLGIGNYICYNWAREIKAIVIIPNFEVPTASARNVLKKEYSLKDVVFNLQRVALLTTALTRSPPDAELIYAAMQDKIHQPYRSHLIPGLTEILKSVTPKTHPGLLGLCLSGAGPTILALALGNFEHIANELLRRFEGEGIDCDWRVLEPAYDGAVCEET